MVDYDATELESSLAVQCASLTTYVMSMAGSYRKDLEAAKKIITKLQEDNRALKEKLIKPKKDNQDEMPVEARRFDPKNAQEPRGQVIENYNPQNR